MVYPPFSPPMYPQDYSPQCPSMGHIPSQTSTLKRKREYDDDFDIDNNEAADTYHSHKKHHVDIRPLTPPSPPLSSLYLSSIQSSSPSSQSSQGYVCQPLKQEMSAP